MGNVAAGYVIRPGCHRGPLGPGLVDSEAFKTRLIGSVMATVTTRPFDRPALDRRVRHPLQALRGYIRTYVLLEGAAVAVIYLALWFWIGLLLDYGTFWLFAFDWIQELNQNLPEST